LLLSLELLQAAALEVLIIIPVARGEEAEALELY
jgi:hypothetical protein